MTQQELDRAVSRATGETVDYVKQLGFELVTISRKRRHRKRRYRRSRLIARMAAPAVKPHQSLRHLRLRQAMPGRDGAG